MKKLLAALLLAAALLISPAKAEYGGPQILSGDCTATAGATTCPNYFGVAWTSLLRGYMVGLVTANDGSSPNTVIDVAVGMATDDTNTQLMQLGSAFTKNMNAAWASGTGNGCSDGHGAVTTLQNATDYWIYLIVGSGKTVDLVCSSQAYGVVDFPSGYTLKRAIGWIKTNGSAQIQTFFQDDETWYYGSTLYTKDISITNQALVSALSALTVPLGVKLRPLLNCAATGGGWIISSPDAADIVPNATFATGPGVMLGTNTQPSTISFIYTDASRQVRVRPNATTNTLICFTYGFQWNRERLK